jgi:hypothetical protein
MIININSFSRYLLSSSHVPGYGGNVNNVQYKTNQNCHYESSPPHNEYILILKKRFGISSFPFIVTAPGFLWSLLSSHPAFSAVLRAHQEHS